MARPSKLTERVRATIIGALAQGYSFAGACRLAGVSSSAVYEWIARGRGDDRRPPTWECVDFANALERIEFADASEQWENRPDTGQDTGHVRAHQGTSAMEDSAFADVSATSRHLQAHDATSEPFADNVSPHEEKGEPTGREWLSQKSRSKSVIDREF